MTVVPFLKIDEGTRARLRHLAHAALCIDADDWGSEDQIAAHNAFCDCAGRQMNDAQRGAWDSYSHKATSDEIVTEALRVLGLRLPLTWFEASAKLKAGDRVVFATSWDIFSEGMIVPEGATGVVTHNWLNEMQPLLCVLPDDAGMRERLKDWGGEVQLLGPQDDAHDRAGNVLPHSDWQNQCPVVPL